MNRLVLITGFANPQSSAERVSAALATHYNYDNYDYLTLGQALDEPGTVERVTKNAEVFTHSAGFIALKGAFPRAIHAFNAPRSSARKDLAIQTLLRQRNERDLDPINNPLRTDNGFLREAVRSPIKHLGPFLKGVISSFDPIETAIDARKSGIDVGLAYTDRDSYVQPTEEFAHARFNGVKIAEIQGVHDELMLRPADTSEQYFTHRY